MILVAIKLSNLTNNYVFEGELLVQTLKIAVIGAGNGGQTFAAHLKQKGHEVGLWNRSKEKINIIDKNGITINGCLHAQEHPDITSTNIKQVIKGKDIILVVLPANAHKEVAQRITPYIGENQLVILNPGRTGGALEFCNTLHQNGVKNLPEIVESQSLFYTCRMVKPGLVNLLAIKDNIELGVLNYRNGNGILNDLKCIYDHPQIGESTLKIGLENIGAMLHPMPVLLNIGLIENRKEFIPHYYKAITRKIADLIESMDSERTDIASKFDYDISSVNKWHGDVYGIKEDNLYDSLQSNSAYASIDSPYNLEHRYISEDIPTGLVPLCEIGKCAQVQTPLIKLMISLAREILGVDILKQGRNARTMGIKGLSVEDIKEVFQGYKFYN